MTDTVRDENGLSVVKKRLVRLYPNKLFWTNTHLSGPAKYSQFLYQIVQEGGNASRLDFTGLQMYYGEVRHMSVRSLGQKLTKEDFHTWKLLAKAMERDLKERS